MTEYQKQVVEAYLKCGSYRGAAKLLGKDPSNLRKLVKQLEGQGDVPWRSKAPNPNHLAIKSSTVQFDADGNVVKEWRRQHPNIELMQDVVDGLCEQERVRLRSPRLRRAGRPERTFCSR